MPKPSSILGGGVAKPNFGRVCAILVKQFGPIICTCLKNVAHDSPNTMKTVPIIPQVKENFSRQQNHQTNFVCPLPQNLNIVESHNLELAREMNIRST